MSIGDPQEPPTCPSLGPEDYELKIAELEAIIEKLMDRAINPPVIERYERKIARLQAEIDDSKKRLAELTARLAAVMVCTQAPLAGVPLAVASEISARIDAEEVGGG